MPESNLIIPTNIFDQLRRDEGVRLKPYTDSVGKITIGIGRNLTDVGISEFEANQFLKADVLKASDALRENLPWVNDLDDALYNVLLNMCFNMGIHGLLSFKNTLAKIQAGDYAGAAQAMLDSKWAQQVGARAHRLSVQMETGIWQ